MASTFASVVSTEIPPHGNSSDDDKCTLEEDSVLRPILFSYEELRKGYVAINCFVTLYLFVILAIVCWRYFVPAVEKFTHDLQVNLSVAGAVVMALGVSVPNLACIIVGIFVAHNDIGLGGVLGGAFFNVFCIPAFCGLVVTGTVNLTAWPTIRDLLAFTFSATIILLTSLDRDITLWDSILMLLTYFIYLILILSSNRLNRWSATMQEKHPLPSWVCYCRASLDKNPTEDTGLIKDGTGKSYDGDKKCEEGESSEEPYRSLLYPPRSRLIMVPWLIWSPALLLLFLIIPDFHRPGWGRIYPLTILTSLVVIAGVSYVIVWMISIIGNTAQLPVTVIGMTILAVGSNLPDIFNSIFAARDGFGEMATSNAFGASIVQMLVCLGIPYLIMNIIQYPEPFRLKEDVVMPLVFLVCSGLLALAALFISHWKISRWVSGLFIVCYISFITPSVVFQELNQMQKVSLCQIVD